MTEDVLGTRAASSADQAKARAATHFEIYEPPALVVDEVVHESEVVADVQEAEEVVEEAVEAREVEAEEIAAIVDVAQTSGQLEPTVQREEESPRQRPFSKMHPLVFFDPSL
ncbi:hypothetical protein Nepgr_030751 [Nepenthes gracilis]|uniref:Uncharacterized protein n=1 Tax=Nepenthes gracilis TaxID=150966 RepID=A0AAD3TFC6_NEPGR|nr:hypothetical protein Nepgr_030751 [Nepenthes gracilis]